MLFSGCYPFICSQVSIVLESVTSAVNLVAVLDPALCKVSADQVICSMVAELESGIPLQLLSVEKSDTVVLPVIVRQSSVIHRPCNLCAVLFEVCIEVAMVTTCAPDKGQIGREVECFVGIDFNYVETPDLLSCKSFRVGPEEVLDDRFAVEDVNF